MTSNNISNMSDAAICDVAAKSIAASNSSGMRAMATGAVYLNVRGVSKATKAMLFTAFTTAMLAGSSDPVLKTRIEGTVSNYVSRCVSASHQDHFKWAVDVTAPLDAAVNHIMPEFSAYWGTVNNIRKSGPDKLAKAKVADTAIIPPTAEEQAALDAKAARQYAADFAKMAVRIDTSVLLEIQAHIAGVLAQRASAQDASDLKIAA